MLGAMSSHCSVTIISLLCKLMGSNIVGAGDDRTSISLMRPMSNMGHFEIDYLELVGKSACPCLVQICSASSRKNRNDGCYSL